MIAGTKAETVIGVIENMSETISPTTGEKISIFGSGGGEETGRNPEMKNPRPSDRGFSCGAHANQGGFAVRALRLRRRSWRNPRSGWSGGPWPMTMPEGWQPAVRCGWQGRWWPAGFPSP